MQVTATCHITEQIARSFPSRPDHVQSVMLEAEESMTATAAERNRRLSSRPVLADIRDTQLGFVELTFLADTEAK